MTFRTYFNFALLLPVFVPGVSMLALLCIQQYELDVGVLLLQVLMFSSMSIVLTWLPYLTFATVTWLWARNKDDVTIKRTSFVLPIWFLPLAVPLCVFAYSNGHDDPYTWFTYIGICLIFGYAYVILLWLAWIAFQRASTQ